jgi:hypothetical protein
VEELQGHLVESLLLVTRSSTVVGLKTVIMEAV